MTSTILSTQSHALVMVKNDNYAQFDELLTKTTMRIMSQAVFDEHNRRFDRYHDLVILGLLIGIVSSLFTSALTVFLDNSATSLANWFFILIVCGVILVGIFLWNSDLNRIRVLKKDMKQINPESVSFYKEQLRPVFEDAVREMTAKNDKQEETK